MSNLKYCVPKSETKLFLYGFSTDSLRILYGSAAVSLITFVCPTKRSQLGAGSSKPNVRQIHCY